jgi:D-psicose/D-tagatose/L-ribulose 3-epimerase
MTGSSSSTTPAALWTRALRWRDSTGRWCVAALRECQEFAGPRGLRIGIEPVCRFETYFVNRAEQALTLADEVGNGCGVVLDAFHMNIEESDASEAIVAVGTSLVNFHVADNNRLPPGRGHIAWDAVLQALESIEYRGPLSVEFVPTIDRTPPFTPSADAGILPLSDYEQHAREALEFMRGQLAGRRLGFGRCRE